MIVTSVVVFTFVRLSEEHNSQVLHGFHAPPINQTSTTEAPSTENFELSTEVTTIEPSIETEETTLQDTTDTSTEDSSTEIATSTTDETTESTLTTEPLEHRPIPAVEALRRRGSIGDGNVYGYASGGRYVPPSHSFIPRSPVALAGQVANQARRNFGDEAPISRHLTQPSNGASLGMPGNG